MLPTLFVSHGSPMFALEGGSTAPALRVFGAALQAPGANPLRGVVLMSPHWMAPKPAVTSHPQPRTWHDFGGFPEPLYHLQYPAPGSPALAAQVVEWLHRAGLPAHADPERPFDHGAWVPLMHLLPEATTPVVQLALPEAAGPRDVYALGAALAPLRKQGVLLVGSGSMTHNLRAFFSSRPPMDAAPEPYAWDFARWVEARLQEGPAGLQALLSYRAPAAAGVLGEQAHPTDEHFLPLFFALGAAGWGQEAAAPQAREPQYLSREVMHGHLAMDALVLR